MYFFEISAEAFRITQEEYHLLPSRFITFLNLGEGAELFLVEKMESGYNYYKGKKKLKIAEQELIIKTIDDEPRELYLINLSLLQIMKLLSNQSKQFVSMDNIVEIFFNSEFINDPVIKIKINPFEYYIGPTDNYIHDGTTTNRKHPDITLTYLGKFVHND